MRYSKQRELILNQVQTRSDHPTANAIYAALREVCPGLSLGTVYRNLNCLVDTGSIRRRFRGTRTISTTPFPPIATCIAAAAVK